MRPSVFKIVDLSQNDFFLYLSQCWKVRYLFLEHQQNQSSLGWAHFSGAFLPIIETQVLKVLQTMEAYTVGSSSIFFDRIVSPVGIGSLSLIFRSSSNLRLFLLVIIFKLHGLKVNSTDNDFSLPILVLTRDTISLVVELKLQAIEAIELDPPLFNLRVVLPGPVEIPWSLHGVNDLLH